jgi:eukaryotic-like serine/threonine-protein kinase
MSTYDPVRVEELFHSAADMHGAARQEFLRAACGVDAELRKRLDSLLAQDSDPSFAPSPLAEAASRWDQVAAIASAGFAPGMQIGSYTLIRELGHGGMGTVYLAERSDGQFRHQAAMKVIGIDLSDGGQVRRFLKERQILARLDHPAIARLLDGGVTSGNRPWFLLEYVDGAKIDKFCREQQLTVRARLELFLQVCGAVEYAHQNLIVHRDIKPANILVASDGRTGLHQVKLLDFGIAKLLADHEELDETGEHTRTSRLLTLDYASPEQARGEPCSTRTDIYSLGTVLYEMLAGRHPLGTAQDSPRETARRLQETEPARPSEAAVHAPDRGVLRGDLDRIVLVAMQKDPARRYSSVEAFAADIHRYLDGFPVSARGDSFRYRATKFIRRNRTLVGAAALLILIVAGNIAALVRSGAATERQRVRAERRFGEIREVARAMIFDIDPVLQGIPGTTGVRKLINDRALIYLDRLSPDAAGDVALEQELATGYAHLATVQGMADTSNLGDEAGARSSLNKSLQLIQASLTADPGNADGVVQYVRTLQLQGQMELASGDPAAALLAHKQALREIDLLLSRTPHPSGKMLNAAAESNLDLATNYGGNLGNSSLGDPRSAIPLMAKALEVFQREAKVRAGLPNAKFRNLYQFSNQALTEMEMSSVYLTQLRQLAEARVHVERALELLHSPGDDLSNAEIERKLLLAEGFHTRVLQDQGDVAGALESSQEAAKLAGELLRADPVNQAAQQDRISAEILEGRAESAAGRSVAGFARIDRALHEAEVLVGSSADGYSGSWLRTNYLAAAAAEMAGGRYEVAQRSFLRAAESAGAAMGKHPSDAQVKFDFSTAEIGLARCSAHAGDTVASEAYKTLAAAAVGKVLVLHPDNPRAQELLAAALL